MTTIAEERSVMPDGTNKVLNRRSLQKGNETLLVHLRKGMDVLDVGCGTGAITAGIADHVGPGGTVVGMDKNEDLIREARHSYSEKGNLSFVVDDITTATLDRRFDVITSARTLQWLARPAAAVHQMKDALKPGGILSILDYNHEKIEWQPEPPESFRHFYACFLKWRSDAGLDNTVADKLPIMLKGTGLSDIVVKDASEFSSRAEKDFIETAGIWRDVAATRGKQIVADGYLTERERQNAIADYEAWLPMEAQSMRMYLLSVSGIN